MVLVVNINHWLDDDGELPRSNPRLRRRALRVARLIEYGGPLEQGESRETLVECSMRPARRPCDGLLWVEKTSDGRIDAYCPACKNERIVISGWEDTIWAEGQMPPLPPLAPIDDVDESASNKRMPN